MHTGIDIIRPTENYADEPIFPIASGKVISIRDDGPYAQIIIEHKISDSKYIWSVYEHISGIVVKLNDNVSPDIPIARFMNKPELNKYGWQFDHFHLEIMKIEPQFRNPTGENPFLLYRTYWLDCFNENDLNKYYHNPLEFLESKMDL